jgi:DNA repair protein RadD
MMLRDYQQRSINQLYDWLSHNSGNPCLVLPTGAGKSHVIAALCKDALQSWPETRILMLTHVKELIEQNAQKMRQHWPNAPMGIYSAGMGQKILGEPITFAGIQSIRKHADQVGHVDLVIIDECHLVNHNDEGGYRTFLSDIYRTNPNVRVIGLTASPYRLGHGYIIEKPAIFDELIEPVTIEELINKGYLMPLRSKVTQILLDITGVHKRGGEYIERELQQAVDTDAINQRVVSEIKTLAGDRKAWLLFCAGVQHAEHIAGELKAQGITAECVTGATPKAERDRILSEFKAGKIQALTNANVLTTGFDYPDIDLIAMLRPTMSPGLYVQMAGRGLRPKSHTDHCLVLDFAGVVEQHGPITAVEPPNKSKQGDGQAPTKTCDECGEIVAISTSTCPACEAAFPIKEKKELKLSDADIMGLEATEMTVIDWHWQKYISKASGKHMLSVRYYSDRMDVQPITEFFPVLHDGYAGHKSRLEIVTIAQQADASLDDDLIRQAGNLNKGIPPTTIKYKRDGKYNKVVNRSWTQNNAQNVGQLSRLQTFIHKNREDIYSPGASNAS